MGTCLIFHLISFPDHYEGKLIFDLKKYILIFVKQKIAITDWEYDYERIFACKHKNFSIYNCICLRALLKP